MTDRRPLPKIGIFAYGAAAILLGLVGLAWGDFATDWQRVQPGVPHRESLAYFCAAYEILAGAALLWRRTARAGALLLTVLYSIFTLLWLIQALSVPQGYDGWGNVFEELSLVIGGTVAFVALAPARSRLHGKAASIGRAFGICSVSFAIVHLLHLAIVAAWVPSWIPPGQMFWSVATAVFFLLAAAAILSGVLAGLAAGLLTAEIMGFEILVWAPRLIEAPHSHFNWAGNAIGIAIGAAAWVVADSLQEARRLKMSLLVSAVPAAPAPQHIA
jgi:uncharacterized membrane protein YphA (DoxX/SURF4 family)